jgi:hypothetical protein
VIRGTIVTTADRIAYSELDDEWDVDQKERIFTSRTHESRGHQRLIFNESFRDGTISAEITVLAGTKQEEGGDARVGALVFRFQDPNNYYYAGIGGHGGRFFIAKMENGQGQSLRTTGRSGSIKSRVPYRIMVRCVGDRITLTHNGITQLSVSDDTFIAGPWGFHTWKSQVEFKLAVVEAVKPTCFVIMPFAPEFDDVYQIIHETVENHRFQCVRADERYLSGPIIEDVFDQIQRADLIVADFTGKNANVFYEAGYANALRKPVVQIAQSVSDLPFDVRHLRTFSYNTKILGDRKLAHDLSEAIRATTGFEPAPPGNGRPER